MVFEDEKEMEDSGPNIFGSIHSDCFDPAKTRDDVDILANSVPDDSLHECFEYNPKKPKWWSKLSKYTTKSQKRAIKHIMETHRLPSVPYGEYIDWSEVFLPEKDIWIEVGFGQGDNFLALAHQKRSENIALVGVEINKAGIGIACQRMKASIEKNEYWTDYRSYEDPDAPDSLPSRHQEFLVNEKNSNESIPYDSFVRLWPGDGVKLFSKIPSSTVAAILVTFPDPFPRNHEKEWRVIQPSTLQEIHRILRKTPTLAGCLYVATDHEGFFNWCSRCVADVNKLGEIKFELVVPCPDRSLWLPVVSRYEAKGWEEGRKTYLSCWTAK